jgi:hypothetical protein
MKASIGVLVTGAVALEGNARFSGGLPPIRIMDQFVNDSTAPSAAIWGQNPPFVGPPSACTNTMLQCTTTADCPLGQQCEQQLTIADPNNQFVNRTGQAAEFMRCVNIIAAVPDTDATVSALLQTQYLSEIHLRAGQSGQIDLAHGQNVIDIDALRIGQGCGLTLKGFADSVAVLRIAGAFRIGTRSHVTLIGITPDNVLWVVAGAGRLARISSHCTFPGTLFAAKRPKISIGAFTELQGSLIGKRIRMGRQSQVEHWPFTALLTGPMVDSPNLAIRSANLSYSNPKRSTGSLRITAIVDDSSAGTFATDLTSSLVSLNVHAGQFNTSVALTGCVKRGDRVFRCHSGDTRATIKTLRDDPNIYNMTVTRRHLSPTQTGPVRPVPPVVVTMQQNMLQREGQISTCVSRGAFSLSCRMP